MALFTPAQTAALWSADPLLMVGAIRVMIQGTANLDSQDAVDLLSLAVAKGALSDAEKTRILAGTRPPSAAIEHVIGSSVQVPVVRPASYAPAWAEKPPGVRVSRTLDVADLLADRQLRLVDAAVALDPPLVADSFYVSDVAVTFYVNDNPPAAARTRWRVRFDLQYSDGSQDQVVVLQPIGASVLPGLVPADVTALRLSVGGDIITIGGEPIYVGLLPVDPTALVLSIGGDIITIGGEPIYA